MNNDLVIKLLRQIVLGNHIQKRMTKFIKAKLKFRVAANITAYHIVSKLIFLKIINSKVIMIRQCKNVKNQHFSNGRTDFWSEL